VLERTIKVMLVNGTNCRLSGRGENILNYTGGLWERVGSYNAMEVLIDRCLEIGTTGVAKMDKKCIIRVIIRV
jgi:hypothetical protein